MTARRPRLCEAKTSRCCLSRSKRCLTACTTTSQILDLRVQTDTGERLGAVSEIIVTGGNDVYVVHKDERRDILIPALPDVVLEVDLNAGVMTVNLPDGLV